MAFPQPPAAATSSARLLIAIAAGRCNNTGRRWTGSTADASDGWEGRTAPKLDGGWTQCHKAGAATKGVRRWSLIETDFMRCFLGHFSLGNSRKEGYL